MRILTFKGLYGHEDVDQFHGLIAWIHIEPKDDKEVAQKVIKKLLNLSNGEKVALVPFAHLHEKVMERGLARELLNFLEGEYQDRSGNKIERIPFGQEKALFLHVIANDSHIKFFHF